MKHELQRTHPGEGGRERVRESSTDLPKTHQSLDLEQETRHNHFVWAEQAQMLPTESECFGCKW